MPTLVAGIVLFLIAATVTVIVLRGRTIAPTAPPATRRGRVRTNPARRALEASGRRRATATRAAHDLPVPSRSDVMPSVPVEVTEESIGVTRREFFNRSLLTLLGLAVAGAGSAVLAFLWPTSSAGGFGSKVKVSGIGKILAQIDANKAPFYVPAARTWLQHYPARALPKAKEVYKPVIYTGMQRGVVALYQRCPHLGCRVPWCQSSQWFECPCHGSKYNAVGEKKAGPAPRGMDRFAIEFNGDDITINSEVVILGPPIGTNTTGQQAEGPLCV
jgi:cytochrome b6-f complex iron-sulfur subunit